MADKTISDLELSDDVTEDMDIPVHNGVQSVKVTVPQLAEYIFPEESVNEAKMDPDLFARIGGKLLAYRVYTTSGSPHTYTKNPAATYVKVTVIGGGGASGSCQTTSGGEGSLGSGGGGGGSAIKIIQNSALGSTETITVGAGGTAGAAGVNAGNAGGTTSFGAHCSATGGAGGEGGAASGSSAGGDASAGGAGSGGDLNIQGGYGGSKQVVSGIGLAFNFGGSTLMAGNTAANAGSQNAVIGRYPGGGAAGPRNGASQSGRAGAAGAAGVVIVEEYS